MRIYTLNNTGAVKDPETEEVYKTDRDGAVDVPDALGAHLLATHFDGEKVWEDGGERSIRLHTEDETRRRDPMTLLAEMQKITSALTGAGDSGPSASDLAEAAKAAKAEADNIQKQADDAAKAEAKAAKEAEAQAAKDAKAAEVQAARDAAAEKKAAAAEAAKAAKAAKDEK